MKTMLYRRTGSGSQIELADRDMPRPRSTQLLVKVAYSSVNPIDWKLRDEVLRRLPKIKLPYVPGFDVAGEVVEVGNKVEGFSEGDWVFARLDSMTGGASAQYVTLGAKAAAVIPEGLSVMEAAAIPMAALTALQALRDRGKLEAGQNVLIVGASGGVGHYAVQIAKAFGAKVTAVCSSEKAEMVRKLGADEVIDYTETSDYSAGAPYSVVLDVVAERPVSAFTELMTERGTYVSTLPSPGILARMALMPLYSKQRVRFDSFRARGDDLRQIARLVEEDKLRTVIDRVYPLAELSEAHDRSREGLAAGKIVVEVCEDCAPA